MRLICKRIALVLVGVLFALAILEAGLQVASYLAVRQAVENEEERKPAVRDARERVVLCVGDSFTYGVGASSGTLAYPAVLEQILNQTAMPGSTASLKWRVINGGWPGRNSAELLQRLPRFLIDERPDYVCVLVGKNNRWSRADMDLPAPTLADDQIESRAWRWRFRTGRLLQIVWNNLRTKPDDPPTDAAAAMTREATILNDEVSESATPTHDPPPEYRRIGEALRSLKQGNRETAERLCDELTVRVRALNDLPTHNRLLGLIVALWRLEDLVEEIDFVIAKYGATRELCVMLIRPLAQLGRYDEALSRADEAFRLTETEGGGPYSHRAYVYRMMGDYPSSIRDSVMAFLQDGDEAVLEKDLSKTSATTPDLLDSMDEILAPLSLDPDSRRVVEGLVDKVWGEAAQQSGESTDTESAARLATDLAHMIGLIREAGATPVVLTYPRDIGPLQQGQHSAAGQEDAKLINMLALFRRRLRTVGKQSLFIKDGHCNDSGYQLMAMLVAKNLWLLESPRSAVTPEQGPSAPPPERPR